MTTAHDDPGTVDPPLERAVQLARASDRPLLLAISGGRDSMAMLELLAARARDRVRAVATFDHGTGAHARMAARLVRTRAHALGLECVAARAGISLRSEAELRAARWNFLRHHARRLDAEVATAHTLDDHLETVVMRIMRNAGARGLAALLAEGPGVPLRPFLHLRRAEVAAWAASTGVHWLEDPSNRSLAFFRNRVRLELLPALIAARPSLEAELLELSTRAAGLRRRVDRFCAEHVEHRVEEGALIVARDALLRYDAQELALLWPSLAARIGLALDRRGTVRLASFTIDGRTGQRIQLSGGIEAIRHRGELRLRPLVSGTAGPEQALVDGLVFGTWRFRKASHDDGALAITLPKDAALSVRSWRPGDRMTPAGSPTPRRLKELFRDAGVDATQRHGWPVVLANEEIVWVPGVRRGRAATARSGRPVVRFVCERLRR